ncbi:DUF6311 domain-containing protein [Polynucleobacter sp. AP-Melu-500A-A1]|uniref:DUF6311 domain-containing protein n=1 Tax=Polynucleobacter sp. AP-Melu-500A-A1 TaxID=2576929 RepID=UPI001C0CC99C|nr:DUF6311 domain-containing protein [Polynucleobacter sp. AP-Melu-500A-A1]MBU3630031.1 hypothetical protein [Polynucleobacter sp. AP-Melu-500A-A1]
MNLQKRDCSFLYALLLGAAAFFMVVGFAPLNPNNADWILGRLDPTQHYLGWLFFRNGPWTFPVGLSPLFGQDLSSSIVYSDSIPLLAIPLKAIGPLLPDRFHYFGIWIFASFLLQAWLAWKILGLYSNSKMLKLLGCGLFVFFPPMLWRINTPAGGHSALVGQFLVLWALYLILRPTQNKRTLLWVLLLSTAVMTHFYLFAIVSLLWLADLANHHFIQRDISAKNALKEILLALIITLLLAWQAGYFAISASLNSERGYGFYGMNVLGLIDSQGWSYILESRTNPSSWGEGFAYLGLGAIIAGLFALIALFKTSAGNMPALKAFFRNHRFLGVLIIFLTFFAISNRVGLGDFSFTYPLPAWLLKVADTLRSSARIFWPIHYLLIITFFVAIVRTFSHKVALGIITVCFILQASDTSKGWLENRKQLATRHSAEEHTHNLSNSFWNSAGKYYSDLTIVPSVNRPPNWENFSIYAVTHHMRTNAAHMARVDLAKQEASNAKLNQQIDTGAFDQGTLYVVENRFVIAALATASDNTAIAKIDTFNVIAPKWNDCSNCPPIDPKLILSRDRYASKLGEVISFANSSPNRSYYFRSGWSWSEDWGTWSDSKNATLNFTWPQLSPKSLNLQFDTFVVKGKHLVQEIDVKVNGVFYKKLFLTHVYDNELDIIFTPEMKKSRYLSIEFEMHNLARPVDLIEDRPDHRKLGIGIRTAIFR